jgi:hypothetical protein
VQLGKLIRELKLKPKNIYNMDEKGFMLGKALKVKVITRRGRRNPRYTQDGTREMVTVVECIAADGRVLPPLYIYKGASHTMGWHSDVQPEDEATFAWSPKGWTDNELGLEWVERNFDKFTKNE